MPGATARTFGRAKALGAAGALAVMSGRDLNDRGDWLQESLAIGIELSALDIIVQARALLALIVLRDNGDLKDLQNFERETLAYARQAGDTWGENRVLVGLAMIALRQGDIDLATARLDEAVGVAREAGDSWSLGMTLMSLGDVERSRGAHVRAGALYEESLAVFTEFHLDEHPFGFPAVLHNLGYVALAAGDTTAARAHFADGMSAYRTAGDKRGIAECVVGLASTAAANGRSEEAARLFGMAEAALEAVGAQLWQSNRGDYERWVSVARASLESTAFAAAWAKGREASFDPAVQHVLESET
jgi:tetratricopeptide (TPR) repeat protein